MSIREEKRAIKKADNIRVKKLIRLMTDIKNESLVSRIKICWYILIRSNM